MELVTAQRAVRLARGRSIPVRCDVSKLKKHGGGVGHRSRGVLIAVRGKKLIIKPHNHKKTEEYPPEYVSLWKSRIIDNNLFTQDQLNELSKPESKAKSPTNSVVVVKTRERTMKRTEEPKRDMPKPPNITPANQQLADKIAGSDALVIADIAEIKNGILTFYAGPGTKKFTDALDEAATFDGDLARANAMRSVGQLKRRPDIWESTVSDMTNLCVLSIKHVDQVLSKAEVKPEAIEPLQEPVVAKKPAVEKPVEKAQVSPGVDAALQKIRASQQNISTIIGMLQEERKVLIVAKDEIVAAVSQEISYVDKVIAGVQVASK